MPKAETSIPTGRRPALRTASTRPVDHLAAGGDDDDVHLPRRRRPGLGPDHLPVEHCLLERHRDLVLGLEADRGVELVLVLDERHAQVRTIDPLVGDADADLLGQLVLGEEILQRRRPGLGVGDLTLAGGARLKRGDAGSADRGRAVARHLGRGDAAGLDVEADDGGVLLA